MMENFSNALFKRLVLNETNQDTKEWFRNALDKLMVERLHGDSSLIKRLKPSYQPWCRRVTPEDKYLEALQASNAELFDTKIDMITEDGITRGDGSHRQYDVIVVATGFVNSRVPPWTMTGRNGVHLKDRWKDNADGYISVCAPDMPNYFAVGCGPNFPIANGPVLSAMGFAADYILKWALKISSEDIKYVSSLFFYLSYPAYSICLQHRSVTVNNEVIEAYNIYLQEILRRTAWNEDCDSWYKKGKGDEYRTGITGIYPGSMNHFREMLSELRGEDFDIVYRSANRFNFVGTGLTKVDLAENGDLASYLGRTMTFDRFLVNEPNGQKS